MMKSNVVAKSTLLSAVSLGVSGIIGSGWLFAAYYTARVAGTMSILAWVIGGVIALLIALLLGEMASMYHKSGLFSRLISISHNRDAGFIFAIANWLALTSAIPSEAVATVQYLLALFPVSWQIIIYPHHEFSIIGFALISLLIVFYCFVNYWGIKALAKTNNVITFIKLVVPLTTAIILLYSSYHPSNFHISYDNVSSASLWAAFNAVVTGGVFYAFFGFNNIALFVSEVDNPSRNIPLALILSIFIALLIYVALQFAFLASVPPAWLQHGGWNGLILSSPLAQLLISLNLNVFAVILYVDSAVSPSGTGIVCLGGASRNFAGMAHDRQMPRYFSVLDPQVKISRRSLLMTTLVCFVMILFFKNWQQIMLLTTVFQLLACVAVPIAFARLRVSEKDVKRPFRVPLGRALSLIVFVIISYFLLQVSAHVLLLSLILNVIIFLIYVASFYRGNIKDTVKALMSSGSVFLYLVILYVIHRLNHVWVFNNVFVFSVLFIVGVVISYWVLLRQKNYFD